MGDLRTAWTLVRSPETRGAAWELPKRRRQTVKQESPSMDLEQQIREAIIAELKRQSENSEGGLTVSDGDAETLTINGPVNLEELAMVVVGHVAGGP